MIPNSILPTTTNSRLRLKCHASQSSQDEFTQHSKDSYVNVMNDHSVSSSNEDSLTDFKSPKAEPVPRASLRIFKFEPEKTKKKLLRSENKPKCNKLKKNNTDAKQSSIESSFFKPRNEKIETGVQCPICFKPFKDEDSSQNHLKSCATKNNITTKKLLEAKQLQDRQAEERKAMGLLAGPIVPVKKNIVRTKKFSSNLDPELQLGLAISESLYEAHQMEELEEAILLAGTSKQSIFKLNEEDRKNTLRNFGFVTNKPQTEIPGSKPRKKKLHGPTTLQSRTDEEKVRVLTERIADILTGEEALTQALLRESVNAVEKTEIIIRSRLLREIHCKTNTLWDKSGLSTKVKEFYCPELRSHMLPDQQGVDIILTDSGLISDDAQEEVNDNNDKKILRNLPLEQEVSEVMEIDQDETNNSKTEKMFTSGRQEDIDVNRKFVEQLVLNWGDALNDSSASDIIILVKNENYIWAHKLVFHVRCSNILLDILPNGEKRFPRIKDKLCWPEINRRSALAFLEFIYCGIIDKHLGVFDDAELLTDVRRLARKYRIRDLFSYIRKKQKELESNSSTNSKSHNASEASVLMKQDEEISIIENVKAESNIDVSNRILKDSTNIEISKQSSKDDTTQIFSLHRNDDKMKQLENSMIVENSLLEPGIKSLAIRRFTASPDLFADFEEENDEVEGTQNLNILANLIEQETKEENRSNSKEANDIAVKLPETSLNETLHSVKETQDSGAISQGSNGPPCSENINESVTPKSHRSKPKSDLSMFIDRIRKENAKTISDTDTDSDSEILKYPVKHRNPFRKQKLLSLSEYVRSPGEEVQKEKRNGLSLLEEIIRDEAIKNPAAFNLTSYNPNKKMNNVTQTSKTTNINEHEISQNESLQDDEVLVPRQPENSHCHSDSEEESTNSTLQEIEMSMYSKYIRKRTRRNSIEKYRTALKLHSKNFSRDKQDEGTAAVSPNISTDYVPNEDDDITLVSDTECNLSEASTEGICEEKADNSTIEDSAKAPNEVTNSKSDKSSSSFHDDRTADAQKSSKVIDLTQQEHSDSDTSIHSASTFNYNEDYPNFDMDNDIHSLEVESISNTFVGKKKDFEKPETMISSSGRDIENQEIRTKSNNLDVSAIEIHSSPEFIDNNQERGANINLSNSIKSRDRSNVKTTDGCLNENDIEGSWFRDSLPESEFSGFRRYQSESPQSNSKDSILEKKSVSDVTNQHISKRKSTDSFIENLLTSPIVISPQLDQSTTSLPGSSLQDNVTSKSCTILSKEARNFKVKTVSRVNSQKTSLQESQRQPKESRSKSFINASLSSDPSKIAPIASSSIQEDMTDNDSVFDSPVSFDVEGGRRCESESERERSSRDLRMLKTKSVSEANYKNSNKSQKSAATPPRSQFSHLIKNFSEMDTPELKRQLNKFGLKPQKRNKAEQLLSHITNELNQRQDLESQKTLSEDEDEPPRKKFHTSQKQTTKKNNRTESNAKGSKNSDIVIAEELELDDTDSASDTVNPLCIKDAFERLLKANKKLHNKILTYESLELEMLHTMLKQLGFKCKVNDLMDFLDEQCITFHVQTGRKRQTKKKTAK